MNRFKSFVKRHPVVTYFVLAYALTWLLAPLLTISLLLGVVGLLMPAVAAIVVSAVTEGKPGVKALLQRLKIWRVGLRWYAVALGLPVLLSAGMVALSVLLGAPAQVEFSPVSLLTMIIFVLVVGEEIGWRGYALPKLLQSHSSLAAGLILGVLWGGWHLPTFLIPGTPQAGIPFVAFLLFTTGASILFTWLYLHTRGSLLIATFFHGAINSFGFVNNALDSASRWWLTGAVYVAAAFLVFIVAGLTERTGPRRGRRILRRTGLGCLGFIGALVACAVFGLVYEAVMAPGDAARYPAPGQRVDIGGYSLHIYCTGEGSPTVILEAGFGAWSTDWATAQPGLSRIARTCSYDRAGLGWSDPGPAPRDPEHIAIELHALLTNAGIEGPYVLAGHSIGGKHIRMFTELYPDEVLGLVFVDARHESAEPVGRTPEQNQQDREAYESSLNFYRVLRDTGIGRIFGLPLSRMLIPGVENIPDDVQYENVLLGVRESTLQAMIAESPATTYSDDRLRAARPLGDLPVVVLTAGLALEQASNWEVVQKNLVALSTNSRWTIVENSLHNIAFDDPDAVITAVQDVIQAAQTGQPLGSK